MKKTSKKLWKHFFHQKKIKSLRKIAKEYETSPSTVYARANGAKPRAEANENHQALFKHQEHLLKGYLIFLA